MNLFQIGWFFYVYMTGCVKCHVYFSTFVLANESWFFVCFIFSMRGASTLSRYFWPVRLPSRTYKSNLQSKEKQPQTVTPPPPKAVVPIMWLSWNEVFRWRQTLARPSGGRNKRRLSSDQWTRLHVRIVHPKWSCDQSNRAWLFTARGCSDNVLACDVARHEPYRACMGLYWPKN
jgi:hypothetical protein